MSVLHLNESEFNAKIPASSVAMVDFWATWCGPCMMLSPIVEELAETHKVGKVNVDEELELAHRYGITSIPTLILFENGQAVRQTMGYQPKEDIEAFLEG